MKLLLIRPRPEKETIGLQHVMIVEPLELEILGATIRKNDSAVIVDMIIEKGTIEHFLALHKPDVLCITGYITNVGTIKRICDGTKNFNEGIITIVGGVHCEVCPDDFDYPTIDYRVVRNAITVFPKILDHIENRNELPAGVLRSGQNLVKEKLPLINFNYVLPDRSLTSKYRDKYFYIFHDKVALMKATFGCPFKCNFCFCRKITEEQYWQRDIEDVIRELETINEEEIYIVDDDFLADRKYVEIFLNHLEKRNIKKKYLIYGRADFIANNPKLIARFRDNGLKTVIVGFESFFEEELESFAKNIDVDTNYKAMEILNKLKVDCYATVILSPDWDKEQFRKLEVILKKLKIHYVNLQPLTPLPGTDFMASKDQLLIERDDYAKWDLAHISISPSKLSVADYYKELLRLYGKVLFQSWVLKKYLFNTPTKMLIKIIMGSWRVRRQYQMKMKEASIYHPDLRKEELICQR
ncbi:MAG: B12-binding domain-containing radical SAM protein [Ignavibacteriae bacterium]|nr:MAG: B12-binding domain-containing radical SAM protein [Ignavibacteriota bacterium]